jgi:hypothetical protein
VFIVGSRSPRVMPPVPGADGHYKSTDQLLPAFDTYRPSHLAELASSVPRSSAAYTTLWQRSMLPRAAFDAAVKTP